MAVKFFGVFIVLTLLTEPSIALGAKSGQKSNGTSLQKSGNKFPGGGYSLILNAAKSTIDEFSSYLQRKNGNSAAGKFSVILAIVIRLIPVFTGIENISKPVKRAGRRLRQAIRSFGSRLYYKVVWFIPKAMISVFSFKKEIKLIKNFVLDLKPLFGQLLTDIANAISN